jgi:hypothetical protein
MTQTDPHTPSPSADAERPAEAFPPFTERLPEAEVWRRARQDHLGGDSAPVVAERYGLAERTLRRKAAVEGWRRVDTRPPVNLDEPPPWAWTPKSRRIDLIHEDPEYAELAAARDGAAFNLLFQPQSDDLRDFAFRRACEAAAMEQPAQSLAWLRVHRLCDQCTELVDPSKAGFPEADHLRAAMLKAMGGETNSKS